MVMAPGCLLTDHLWVKIVVALCACVPRECEVLCIYIHFSPFNRLDRQATDKRVGNRNEAQVTRFIVSFPHHTLFYVKLELSIDDIRVSVLFTSASMSGRVVDA